MQAHAALREPRTATHFRDVAAIPAPAVLDFLPIDLTEKTIAEPATAIVHTDMHPGVYKIAVLSWALFIGIFWLTFWQDANALFMVAASTAYAVVFFGVPTIMSRCVPKAAVEGGLMDFLRARVDTLYGPVNGFEALVQVILVPAALILGGTAMSFAIQSARLVN